MAKEQLAKGRLGIVTLPSLGGGFPNRSRQTSSVAVEGGKLERQLKVLEEYYSAPYNGSREGRSIQLSTWRKAQLLVQQLGWWIKQQGEQREMVLELLLNAGLIRSWVQHLSGERGIQQSTITTYLSSLSSILLALQSMQLHGMCSRPARLLIEDLSHLKGQVNHRSSITSSNKRMKHSRMLMQAILEEDVHKLAQQPGALMYGLAVEHSFKLAEAWMEVSCTASPLLPALQHKLTHLPSAPITPAQAHTPPLCSHHSSTSSHTSPLLPALQHQLTHLPSAPINPSLAHTGV